MFCLKNFGLVLLIFGCFANGDLVPLQKCLNINPRPAPSNSVRYENSYYKYYGNPKTWPEARAICEDEGGHLVIVNSYKEVDFLISFLKKNPASTHATCYPQFVLIGFHSFFQKDEFVTVAGESLRKSGYNAWDQGEPNGQVARRENCGSIARSGGLNDITCDCIGPFICEIPVYDFNEALRQTSTNIY